jgi:hemolysin III
MATARKPESAPIAQQEPLAKPLLRGWLHLGMAPLILVAGLLLTALSPTVDGRVAAAIYTLSAVMLFGTSAAYHRGNWTPSTLAVFRRLDHSNIFVFIAGTYTPLAMNLLDGTARWTLLVIAWSVAVLGVAFRLLWLGAPRWLYTILYVAMGWMAVGWLPQLWVAGGPAVVLLVIVGGLIYSLGAAAYATKRPQLSPKWFGFHEVFHTATILAAVCHLVAIWLSAFAS